MNKVTKSITVNILSMISDMAVSKEQKEDFALKAMKLTRDKATVIWKDDRIDCIRLNDSLKTMDCTITIVDEEEKAINGKHI